MMHHIMLMKLVRGTTRICEPDIHIDNSPGVHREQGANITGQIFFLIASFPQDP